MPWLAEASTVRINARLAAYAPIAALLAFLVVVYPLATLALSLAWVAFAVLTARLSRAGTEVWQLLVMLALTGYIILNWGFANLAFRVAGMPLIIGHALMFAALALAAFSNPNRLVVALREPAILCLSALVLLSSIHLIVDVPRYGLYAVRDSSVFLEGVFLVLGLAWARKETNLLPLMKFLFAVFLVNLIYSFSFPWAESLSSWSPKSGIFLVVPVLGSYAHNYLYLLAGALFCLWVGKDVVGWPRPILILLAVAQVFALAIHQARSTYVGLLVVLLALAILGEFRKWATLTATLAFALGVFLVLTSIGELRLQGRLGPVTPAFLQEHAQSLLLEPGTPGLGTIYGRWQWYTEVWDRAQSSTTNLLVGEGFGTPLIDFKGPGGVAVRQPHNTHLSVLARLGLVGLAFWTLFHLSIIARFLRALLLRPRLDAKMRALILWLFLFYVLAMIVTTVQPYLEFSYGAIPFYFFVGLALGITGRHREMHVHADNGREDPAHP